VTRLTSYQMTVLRITVADANPGSGRDEAHGGTEQSGVHPDAQIEE